MQTPQLIQVRKYPNRRLYDQTRSRHMTVDELYELVLAGHTVRVTDSKSDQDITNGVLLQALLERDAAKLSALPPEWFHLIVRASDQILRSMSSQWLNRLAAGMFPFPGAAVAAPASPTAPGWFAPWSPPTAAAYPPTPSKEEDLRARLDAITRELDDMRRTSGTPDRA